MADPTHLSVVTPELRRPPARLTVSDTVYYQSVGADPEAVDHRFSRFVASDEQPYARRLTIPTAWVRLDPGWLAGNVGMMKVVNEGHPGRTALPTAGEREADAGLVVELAVSLNTEGTMAVAFARLRPGESLRFEPTDPGRLMLRCVGSGPTRVLLNLYPA